MLLIGLFALVLMLVPGQVHAAALFVPIIAAALGGGFLASAAAFIVVTAISMAVSFAITSLLKPASSARGQTFPGTSQPVIDNKINVRQPTAPRQVIYGEARVGGVFGFMHSTSSNKFLHVIVLCAGHEVHQFAQVWIGDEAFVSHENAASAAEGDLVIDENGFVPSPSQFAGKVRVRPFKGAPGQVIDADLLAECSDVLTAEDTFAGMAGVYVRLEFDQALFRDIPNITCVIKGKKDIYDPRTDTTGWSVNSALIVANYLCDPVYGIGVDYAGGIVESALIASANGSDEQVDLAGGGTESRFETYGSFKSSDKPREILGRLLGAMHGRAPYDGERWRILAGIYQSPTRTITEADLRAGPKVQTLVSRRDRFNAVKGTYINPATFWQEADFPPIVSESYAILDGEPLYSDIVLPFTRSAAMAQRIAKISLLLSRQEYTATLPGKLSLWRHQAGDTAWFTYPRYGWTAKPFEVRDVTLTLDAENRLACDLKLAATGPEVYDWATSEEVPVDPNPGTGGPDANTVAPPTNLTVTEEVYETAPGQGMKSRLLIDWDPSPDGFLKNYRVEMKPQSVTDWDQTHVLGSTVGTETHWTIEDVAKGYWHVRIAAINIAEKRSTYIQESVTVSGDTTPPEDVTGFTEKSGISGLSTFTWNAAVTERARNGTVEIRFQAVITGATWEDATPVFRGAGTTTIAVLRTEIGTYGIKYRSANGVYSEGTGAVVITTLAQAISGYEIVTSLPTAGNYNGRVVFLDTNDGAFVAGRLYVWVAPPGEWRSFTRAEDITGLITDDQIDSMDVTKLVGLIQTGQLASQLVTADKMMVADYTQFTENNNFSLGAGIGWGTVSSNIRTGFSLTMPSNAAITAGNGYNGSANHLLLSAGFVGTLWNSKLIQVTPGEKYFIRAAVQRISSPNRDIRIRLHFVTNDGNTLVAESDTSYVVAGTTDSTGGYTVKETADPSVTVPATAAYARVGLYSQGGTLASGSYRIGLVTVLRRNGGELIVDGAVTATKMSANSVTTNSLAAGAATFAKINVNQLSLISADAGTLTAGTITGLLIRTGSGTTRVEIASSGSYPNALTAYVGGAAVATFGGTVASGDGFVQVVGSFPLYYPGKFHNSSTTGGGGGLGGGAAKVTSVGGWAFEAGNSATGAGSPLPTAGANFYNSGAGGGGLYAGMSAGAGGWSGYAYSGNGYGPFTGAHDGLLPKEIEPEVGDLIVDTDIVRETISDVMTIVGLSGTEKQKNVVGVFVARNAADAVWAPASMTEDEPALIEVDGRDYLFYPPVPEWADFVDGHDLVVLNALGEGMMNVCGAGGDLHPGDLLCASGTPGKAMKQDDDLLHGYTVGRVRLKQGEVVTFASPSEVKRVSVFYCCG